MAEVGNVDVGVALDVSVRGDITVDDAIGIEDSVSIFAINISIVAGPAAAVVTGGKWGDNQRAQRDQLKAASHINHGDRVVTRRQPPAGTLPASAGISKWPSLLKAGT